MRRRWIAALDHAVFDIQNPVEDIKGAMIVGDDDDARAALVGDAGKQLHHLPAAPAVERGGRLIGQDQAGLVGQRAGDGDALLLAAGERVGEVIGTRTDAELIQQFVGTTAEIQR